LFQGANFTSKVEAKYQRRIVIAFAIHPIKSFLTHSPHPPNISAFDWHDMTHTPPSIEDDAASNKLIPAPRLHRSGGT